MGLRKRIVRKNTSSINPRMTNDASKEMEMFVRGRFLGLGKKVIFNKEFLNFNTCDKYLLYKLYFKYFESHFKADFDQYRAPALIIREKRNSKPNNTESLVAEARKRLNNVKYINKYGAGPNQMSDTDVIRQDKIMKISKFGSKKSIEKSNHEFLKWRKFYKEHLNSPKWKSFRLSILNLYGHTCQKCKNTFSKRRLHVHHLHYKTLGNEGFEDVLLVCKPCHEKIHNKPIN